MTIQSNNIVMEPTMWSRGIRYISDNIDIMDPTIWSRLTLDIFNVIADFLPPDKIKGMPNQVIVNRINAGKTKFSDLFANADDAICFAAKWNCKKLWVNETRGKLLGFGCDTQIANVWANVNYVWTKEKPPRRMYISFDKQITDVGVRRLIASANLSNLYKLDLRGCDKVTEAAFRDLLTSLSTLGRVWTKGRRIKFKKGSK